MNKVLYGTSLYPKPYLCKNLLHFTKLKVLIQKSDISKNVHEAAPICHSSRETLKNKQKLSQAILSGLQITVRGLWQPSEY